MQKLSSSLLFFIALVSMPTAPFCRAQACRSRYRYAPVNASLCISSDFTRTVDGIASTPSCALLCSQEPRCQAFTTETGPCQLFVFDRCSKAVRNCSCSRRGRVFVKQQPGLAPGSLCPPDYGDDRCGVKYRVHSEMAFWTAQKQRCESGGGLAMMADVIDLAKMSHINQLYANTGLSIPLFLDGYQPTGSAEPRGGWVWSTCDIAVNDSLWASPEPDNRNGNEEAIIRGSGTGLLYDVRQNSDRGVLCECVSPFD